MEYETFLVFLGLINYAGAGIWSLIKDKNFFQWSTVITLIISVPYIIVFKLTHTEFPSAPYWLWLTAILIAIAANLSAYMNKRKKVNSN